MKKVAAALSMLSFLSFATKALAQVQIAIPTPTDAQGHVIGVNPGASVGGVIGQIIVIIFVVGIIAVLFMFILGAFSWITSGGEKEAVEKSRKRITAALIGMAILVLSFLIVRVVGLVLNVNVLNLTLPSLGVGIPSQP